MEATRSGIARSAFQASQQAATMVVVAVKDAVREVVLAEELLACPYRVVQFQPRRLSWRNCAETTNG